MSDPITGSIDNGLIGLATIGTYTGPVGISRPPDTPAMMLAYRGKPQMRVPTEGVLNGVAIVISALKRSDLDPQLMIATATLAE